MPVRLPIGMARVCTCGPITAMWVRMPSGVSSIKPLGAVENPGSVGDAAWQGTQRSATMCYTAENSAAGVAAAAIVEGAARGARAAAAAARTSTPSSAGQGEVLPPRKWRL